MSDKQDAERYRWLRSQYGLTLESSGMQWTRIKDGSKFIASHRLCANDRIFSAFETLDETIDEAILLTKEN